MQILPQHDVVLVGIGHTNAHVLRMWRMRPISSARLTCVSAHSVATYSGMLPGVLAGQYPPDRMELDLVRLCAAAGARLIVADAAGVDIQERRLRLTDRASIRFDVLSIGIGSEPSYEGVNVVDHSRMVPIKPMQTLLARLRERLFAAAAERRGAPLRLAIVGGGAGGVEVALCLPSYVRHLFGDDVALKLTLVSGGRLLPGMGARTALRVERALSARAVRLLTRGPVVRVDRDGLVLEDGTGIEADVVIWATGAAAPPLLARLGLPLDKRGFLLTASTLQSVSGAPVFAVGDTGTIVRTETPKAGVYAVRQGTVLWENIGRYLARRRLRRFVPQRGFLKLLNTGDGCAIAEWRGISLEGRWCWRLKYRIDSRFMGKHQNYTPMPMAPANSEPTAMRCLGCGGKIGATVLTRVLDRLEIPANEHVVLGLQQPDDAAIVRAPGGRAVTVTADFFAAPLDDPYVVGRLAALNAASDAYAMGAAPYAALAMVTLPLGSSRQQEELLYQVLAGSLAELRSMRATLVGGHTIEGPRLTVGFTVIASQLAHTPRTKGRLRGGDRLVLTKPIGTGVLLAAHMRALCHARWFDSLVRTMLVGNGPASSTLDGFDVSALTDVTGFGFASHLLEMLRASDAVADVYLDSIPVLPGVDELVEVGIESTLAAANRDAEAEIEGVPNHSTARYSSLFDPQTSGGLLIGVAAADAERLVAALRALDYEAAAVVGEIDAAARSRRRIRIVRE